MTIQYKKRKFNSRWIDYHGKKTLTKDVNEYLWRLLDKTKTKILVPSGTYEKIIKRFRQIEYFKHKK